MVIRSTTLRSIACASLLALVVVGCNTPKKSETFPVIWEDDARDARTHHDESHQDALPMLAGPVVEPSLSDHLEKGRWGVGVSFAPHAEENVALTGAVSGSRSSHSVEVMGLNVGYMFYDDFEIRIGHDQAKLPYDDNAYQGVFIPGSHLGTSDLSIGFRHYTPTYRVRPYFGADLVIRSWDDVSATDALSGDTVRVSMDDQTLLALEVGLRYLWNSSSSVQLGLRWMDPIEGADGTATHKDSGGTILNSDDDLRATHDSLRLLFGINWMF